MSLRIRFHKLSDARHRLELRRADGTEERRELETRSLLRHDLMHYAVERAAGVASGFWGRLAGGASLTAVGELDLRSMTDGPADDQELAVIERLVGVLHDGGRGRPAAELVAALDQSAADAGTPLPTWVTEDLVARALTTYATLIGRWRATGFGSAMELVW